MQNPWEGDFDSELQFHLNKLMMQSVMLQVSQNIDDFIWKYFFHLAALYRNETRTALF